MQIIIILSYQVRNFPQISNLKNLFLPFCKLHLPLMMLIIAFGLVLPGPTSAQIENVKLNGEFLPRGQDVFQSQVSPDSKWVVYRANHDAENKYELYSVPTDGSNGPVKLNGPLLTSSIDSVDDNFSISPDSQSVYYIANQEAESYDLYRVPIDGSSPPTKLNSPLGDDGRVWANFEISPDSQWVVYTAQQNWDSIVEIYSVSLVSGVVVKLNEPIGTSAPNFQISPDSNTVVYTAKHVGDDGRQIYRVPIDGSIAPVKVNGTLVSGGSAGAAKISPDGNTVVYAADQETDEVRELYSVPLDGSAAPIKLNGPLTKWGDVHSFFHISPDSSRVIYLADQETSGVYELYSVPLLGGSVIKLNGSMVSGGDVSYFRIQISSDSSYVVYVADQDTDGVDELYSVPLLGGSVSKLNGPMISQGDVHRFSISPDNSRVIYVADQQVNEVYEIYSVEIGGAGLIKLNPTLVNGGSVFRSYNDFQISSDSNWVVYRADQETENVAELYLVPATGGDVVKLNGNLGSDGYVNEWFHISPDDSRIIYRADQVTNNVIDLYSVILTGGDISKLSEPRARIGDVEQFFISSDGTQVVYLADQNEANMFELYSVPTTGGNDIRLNTTPTPAGYYYIYSDAKITPDNSYIIYRELDLANQNINIFSVPLNGQENPIQLNGLLPPYREVQSFQISPSGTHIVYRAEQEIFGVFELYRVPIDGSSDPIKLNTSLDSGRSVGHSFAVSPDGSRVIYRADQDEDNRFELYSVPLNGGSVIKLNGGLVAGGNVSNFKVSPDSRWVIYRADQDEDNRFELYSVPLNGGSVTNLNGGLVAGGDISDYSVSPDSRWVIYRADQNTDEVYELYSVPIDGGSVSKLNSNLVSDGNVSSNFQISSDSNWVVYQADQETDELYQLYSVNITGADSPNNLSNIQVSNRDARPDFQITPGGEHVVFLTEKDGCGELELSNAPIDGTQTPIKLVDPLVTISIPYLPLPEDNKYECFYLSYFQIDKETNRVIYLAIQDTNYEHELFSISLDGSNNTKLNPALPEYGGVIQFQVAPNNHWVVYKADQDFDEVVELYASQDAYSDLAITKSAFPANPIPGQTVTYTITVANTGLVDVTNAVVSDTLPSELTFVGPVTIQGTTGISGPAPILASNLTISSGTTITITFPVTVSIDLEYGTYITNTAIVTGIELPNLRSDTHEIVVSQAIPDNYIYIPVVLKDN